MIHVTDLRDNKIYILASTIIFFGALILAAIFAMIYPASVTGFFSQFFRDIQELGDQIFAADPLIGTWKLFLNNFRASMIFIFGGLILALPTFFGLAMNGGAIGALGVISTLDGISPFTYILAIAPHGVFEIPAVIISGGFGLKIGVELIKPRYKSRLTNLKNNFYLVLRNLPLIIILLLIAAVIELFITPYLLSLVVEL